MKDPITVKIQQLHAKAIIPRYQTAGSAGMDLHAVADSEVWVGETAVVPIGIGISIPPGYEAQIRPRSGLAASKSISVINSPGTIDSDYRGEVKVILVNHGDEIFRIKCGDRIAQLVFAPVTRAEFEAVASLDETPRGTGGFGSTGA
jgi:dUTP pyrophosphatase